MNAHSPTPAAATGDWRLEADCRDHDPEVFFPVGNSAAAQADAEEAKAVCRGCPFREKCLSHALDQDIRHGIWGGLTERERARLGGYLAPDEAGAVDALLEHAGALITQLDADGLRPGEIADRLRSTPQAIAAALTKLNLKPTPPGRPAETGDTA